MRDLVWASEAWEDYLWWQTQDRKTLKRINTLWGPLASTTAAVRWTGRVDRENEAGLAWVYDTHR